MLLLQQTWDLFKDGNNNNSDLECAAKEATFQTALRDMNSVSKH